MPKGWERMDFEVELAFAIGSVAKNVWQSLPVSATVLPADFQNVSSGAYSDSVTLSLLP